MQIFVFFNWNSRYWRPKFCWICEGRSCWKRLLS